MTGLWSTQLLTDPKNEKTCLAQENRFGLLKFLFSIKIMPVYGCFFFNCSNSVIFISLKAHGQGCGMHRQKEKAYRNEERSKIVGKEAKEK